MTVEHVNTILPLLINCNISFYMSTIGMKSKEAEKRDTPSVESKTSSYLKPTKNEILKNKVAQVYQKYIVEGVEKIPPTQNEIAAELGISILTFKSHFKALYNKPFYQVYMDKRMEYAAKLLLQGYRGNKVSVMLGYGEKSCIKFNKMFQKHFGTTPKMYQIMYLKK